MVNRRGEEALHHFICGYKATEERSQITMTSERPLHQKERKLLLPHEQWPRVDNVSVYSKHVLILYNLGYKQKNKRTAWKSTRSVLRSVL
ncbi:hypothetical protein MHYP_G00065170 [Metynnis hypsauchen]